MRLAALLGIILCLAGLLVGCQGEAPAAGGAASQPPDLLAQAQAEATAIILQARATAVVLQAKSQADALLGTSQAQPDRPAATLAATAAASTAEPIATAGAQETASSALAALPGTPSDLIVEAPVIAHQGDVALINVTLAAEGGFVMINFITPPRLSSELYQGRISVTDEASGEVYDEIPVMPVIGPLIGRPVQEGQRGYAMLINRPPQLQVGALVTVVIADARFEHITVE
jgi:hypothetical protein